MNHCGLRFLVGRPARQRRAPSKQGTLSCGEIARETTAKQLDNQADRRAEVRAPQYLVSVAFDGRLPHAMASRGPGWRVREAESLTKCGASFRDLSTGERGKDGATGLADESAGQSTITSPGRMGRVRGSSPREAAKPKMDSVATKATSLTMSPVCVCGTAFQRKRRTVCAAETDQTAP